MDDEVELNAIELLEEGGVLNLKLDPRTKETTLDFRSMGDEVKTVKLSREKVLQLAEQLTNLACYMSDDTPATIS